MKYYKEFKQQRNGNKVTVKFDKKKREYTETDHKGTPTADRLGRRELLTRGYVLGETYSAITGKS